MLAKVIAISRNNSKNHRQIALPGADQATAQQLAKQLGSQFPELLITAERRGLNTGADQPVIYLDVHPDPAEKDLSDYRLVCAPAADEVRADDPLITPWLGHPKLKIISQWSRQNSPSVELLVDYLVPIIAAEPEAEQEYKFLLNPQGQDLVFIPELLRRSRPIAEIEIEQKYLPTASGNQEQRLRRWRVADNSEFYFQSSKQGAGFSRQEQETWLGAAEYQQAISSANGAPTVNKRRYIFLDQGRKWELDNIGKYWLLELEVDKPDDRDFQFPEIISGMRPQEVTGRQRWSNRQLALNMASADQ